MQSTFDWLYQRSQNKCTKGLNLYEIITSENNILLAYRMIKTNTGSRTAGVDGITISDFKIKDTQKFIKEIREALTNFQPQVVRRVEIPKANGKKRPLGIPTMRDRIIQQMFKQVMEPICEAQFFKHSYGFRPNRSVEHAISRCSHIVNVSKNQYVVDIDIEGFFDNVNHAKLLKQLYTIGIKDARVLSLVSKMLKAPVDKVGVQSKGTPQGAILSPLLSNVVLNSLDWWIANQWETFKSDHRYFSNSGRYRALKTTNLKEMYIVRYADDFKIFTRNPKSAIKIFHAVKGYLKNQLKLDISPEKSKITNLRKRYSEFLGFELKVNKCRNDYVGSIKISEKAKCRLKKEIRARIIRLKKYPTVENIIVYNSFVRGIHNYYCKATRVNLDFSAIYFSCLPVMFNRLKSIGKYEIPRSPPQSYVKLYGRNHRTFQVQGINLIPISKVRWKLALFFNPNVSDYTSEGRALQIKKLEHTVIEELYKLCKNDIGNKTVEFSDNKLSRYSMQDGKCAVTGRFLTANEVHCHHKIPRYLGGKDTFSNLIIVHKWVHRLIHMKKIETINEYMAILKLNKKQLSKLNTMRKLCNLTEIYQ
ncbi:group II intron reverse transcriptase/maturase [Enterococcus wangshanyuanii]|nr:group II intron reverse transcriptase/maturase [Enterococcus wangshanyuanii]